MKQSTELKQEEAGGEGVEAGDSLPTPAPPPQRRSSAVGADGPRAAPQVCVFGKQ